MASSRSDVEDELWRGVVGLRGCGGTRVRGDDSGRRTRLMVASCKGSSSPWVWCLGLGLFSGPSLDYFN